MDGRPADGVVEAPSRTLADRARALQKRNGPDCTVGTLLARLDPAYRAEVESLMDDKTYAGTVIAALLREDGHDISASPIVRHRRGECRCGR